MLPLRSSLPPTLLVALLTACSSASAPSDAGDAGPDAVVDAGPPPRPAACQAQDQKLQAALDRARKSPNALLAVRNVECGTSVYVSGDPRLRPRTALAHRQRDEDVRLGGRASAAKDGKLGLDDLLSKWVPNVAGTTGVTIRMLLGHRSGIFNYTEDPAFLGARNQPWTPQQLVDLAAAHAPYFAAGTDFHYSNTNYVLLGMILEKATSMKVGAALRARRSAPAKLSATFLDGEDPVDENRLARGFWNAKDVTLSIHPSARGPRGRWWRPVPTSPTGSRRSTAPTPSSTARSAEDAHGQPERARRRRQVRARDPDARRFRHRGRRPRPGSRRGHRRLPHAGVLFPGEEHGDRGDRANAQEASANDVTLRRR